jgi:ribosomal protein L37E
VTSELQDVNLLLTCSRCGRNSPATRQNCLYCGAAFPITPTNVFKNRRKVDAWEKGYNVIFLSINETIPDIKLPEILPLIEIDEESLRKIFQEHNQLPLTRTATLEEAKIVAEKLDFLGIRTRIIDDFSLSREPSRIRRIDFLDEQLIITHFNSGKTERVFKKELSLVVCGFFYERRIHSIEERKKRQNKLKEASEFDNDRPLIDIYTKSNSIGYRVFPNGFDFSGLGIEKKRLATENLPMLLEKLSSCSSEVNLIDNYTRIYKLLRNIWDFEQSKNSIGWRRKGFGGFELESELLINNLNQFTKYSRLQWFLKNG